MNDWLKKWYNNQFDKIDVSPSSEVWENISETMEDWPKHWYSSNISEIKTEPRASTWEGLESQLANLSYGSKYRRYLRYVTVVFLISIICLPFHLSDQNYEYGFKRSNITQAMSSEFGKSTINTQTNPQNITGESGEINSVSKVPKGANIESIANNPEKNQTISHRILSEETRVEINSDEHNKSNLIQKDKQEQHLNLTVLPLRLLQLPKMNLTNLSIKKKVKSKEKNDRFLLGISFIPQFSSIRSPLSDKVSKSEDKELQNPLSLGIGVSLEKKLTNQHSIRADLKGNNIKQFKYTNSENTVKSIKLNYLTLETNYVRNWHFKNHEKLTLKTFTGVYLGYLVNRSVRYNADRINYIEDGFKHLDFGSSVGVLISTQLAPTLNLEFGAVGQFGVINTFKGTSVLPSKYFNTFTQSYGLTVGLSKSF